MHKECLTRRYLLHRLDLLKGLLGFGLSGLGTLKSQGKLGLSSLRVTLQTLVFSTRAWSSCRTSATRASCFSRSVRSKAALFSALETASFRVATSAVAPATFTLVLSLFATKYFYIHLHMVLHIVLVLELLLGTAELVLGPLEALLQCIDLRSQCGRGQQRSLHSHIDIFLLDSCVYLFRSSARLFFPNTKLSIRGYCLCGNIFICF